MRRRWVGSWLAVTAALLLVVTVTPAASGHPNGRKITQERVQNKLQAKQWIDLAICNGQGRAANPDAPDELRRYKHFGCVIFTSKGKTKCARVHVLRSGRLELGRVYNGLDPDTPPRACGK